MSDERAAVEAGQVWRDNDPRETYRTIEVLRLCEDEACVRGRSRRGGELNRHAHVLSSKNTRSVVRLDRFNPNRRDGYSLVVPAAVSGVREPEGSTE